MSVSWISRSGSSVGRVAFLVPDAAARRLHEDARRTQHQRCSSPTCRSAPLTTQLTMSTPRCACSANPAPGARTCSSRPIKAPKDKSRRVVVRPGREHVPRLDAGLGRAEPLVRADHPHRSRLERDAQAATDGTKLTVAKGDPVTVRQARQAAALSYAMSTCTWSSPSRTRPHDDRSEQRRADRRAPARRRRRTPRRPHEPAATGRARTPPSRRVAPSRRAATASHDSCHRRRDRAQVARRQRGHAHRGTARRACRRQLADGCREPLEVAVGPVPNPS